MVGILGQRTEIEWAGNFKSQSKNNKQGQRYKMKPGKLIWKYVSWSSIHLQGWITNLTLHILTGHSKRDTWPTTCMEVSDGVRGAGKSGYVGASDPFKENQLSYTVNWSHKID